MKALLKLLFFLLVSIRYTLGQDSLLLLYPKMLDEDGKIVLSENDGWLFKEGNDSSWANKNIPLNGWKKLKPSQLSAIYADKEVDATG